MFRAHLVVDADVSPFEYPPERFHSVRVGFLLHIVADRIPDGLMLMWQANIGSRLISIDSGIFRDILQDKSLERAAVCCAYYLQLESVSSLALSCQQLEY